MFNRIYALLVCCYIIISCSVEWMISCIRHGREFEGEINRHIATWPRVLDYSNRYSNPADAMLGLLAEMDVEYSDIDINSFEVARYKPWCGVVGYNRQEMLESICNSISCYIVTNGEQIVLKEVSDAEPKE